MIKITKIVQSDEHGVEFSLAIPPEYLSLIIQAGINTLITSGAAQFIEMTQEEFDKNPPKSEEEISKAEAEMWGSFLKDANPKDLPQG